MRRLGSSPLGAGAVALFALALASPARAQQGQFGQWWWDGVLGAQLRNYESAVDGTKTSTYRESGLRFGLDLNGYLLHPAVGSFRLGLGGNLSRFETSSSTRFSALDLDGELNLFPRGRVVMGFFAGRSRYRLEPEDANDPLAALSPYVDSSTRYGGRLRVRTGFLRGLFVSAEGGVQTYSGEGVPSGTNDREQVEWSRTGDRIQHLYKLERQYKKYGDGYDFAWETVTLTAEEHGKITDSLRWDTSGFWLRQHEDFRGESTPYRNIVRAGNRLLQETSFVPIDFRYDLGLTFADDAKGIGQSHAFNLSTIWPVSRTVTLAPGIGYAFALGPDEDQRIPSANLSASWQETLGKVFVSATGQVGYVDQNRTIGGRTDGRTAVSYSGSVSSTTGSMETLHVESSMTVGRNQLRTTGELGTPIPGLQGSTVLLDVRDVVLGRLVLAKSLGAVVSNFEGHWDVQRSSDDRTSDRRTEEAFYGVLSLTLRAVRLSGSAGHTRREEADVQTVDHRLGSIDVALGSFLSLGGVYGTDRTRVDFGPSLDSETIQARLNASVGRFVLSGYAYRYETRLVSGSDRVDRGIVVSLSRSFGGLLPFVSRVARKGVVK